MSPQRSERRRANFVAEWFGHRVYPDVAATPDSLADQRAQRCPFLSDATGSDRRCVKLPRSLGVCTISSTSNGPRQDWLVCPYRGLDLGLLRNAASRLFAVPDDDALVLVAASVLADASAATTFRNSVAMGKTALVYFQNKLGGEISISSTDRSPEFSFDVTMVHIEAERRSGGLALGRYGIFEIQTMDFHGSYSHAVGNLQDALRLHPRDFGGNVRSNPNWLSEGVEGPNIANVFKRTFYQMMVKFQIGNHEQAAGCVFAISQSVWDSWQRHLARPELVPHSDGTVRLARPSAYLREPPPAWIYVFDIQSSPDASPNRLSLATVIGTDAPSLSHYALDVAPAAALAEGGSIDRLRATIASRLSAYFPELRPERARARAPRPLGPER